MSDHRPQLSVWPARDGRAVEHPAWPRLEHGEVHVWKACLDGLADDDSRALLSPDEIVRADSYRFPRDRLRFASARAVLRMILGRYLLRPPKELVFSQGAQGKPRLVTDPAEALHFNVSHADSIALYAITREGAVGIDLERIREIPDWAGIADTFFTPGERASLSMLTADRRKRAFLQAWTRREALLKASGEGLTGETCGRSSPQDATYAVRTLVLAPGYLAALASAHSTQRVVFMTWSGTAGLGGYQLMETQNISHESDSFFS